MSENYSYNVTPKQSDQKLNYEAALMSNNPSSSSIILPIHDSIPSNTKLSSHSDHDIQHHQPYHQLQLPAVATRKRSRSTKACIACHNKKVKCDLALKADDEKCSNCVSSKTNCVLYARKKRAANKKAKTTISAVSLSLDSISNPTLSNPSSVQRSLSLTPSIPLKPDMIHSNSYPSISVKDETEPVRKPSLTSHLTTSILSSNLSEIESHPEDKKSSNIPSFQSKFLKESSHRKHSNLSEIKLDPDVILKENMHDLMMTEFGINEASNNSFMKKIINTALPKMTQDFKRSYILDQLDFEILDSYGCFSLPDETTCRSYIDNFFEFINPQLPIIDKTHFNENYSDLHNPPSLLLLYSILSVGAWHMNSDPENPDAQLENIEKSQVLFKRAKLLYEYSIEAEPIALLQSVLCFTFHHDNMSNLGKNDYYWTHVAVNLAVQYGFHLKPPPTSSKYFKNIRKRLWWIIYFKDRFTAFGYSRPTCINLNESEYDMIKLEDLEDSGMTYLESIYLVNLIKFGKLVDEIGDIQNEISRLYTTGRPIIHLMKKCDLTMIGYLENLPTELVFQFKVPSTHSFLSMMLLTHYYTMLTVVHRANIQRHTTDIYPSWAISFQAVQMIKIMSDCLVSKRLISKVALVSHNTLTSSCIIMVYHLLNEDKKISKVAKEFFLRTLGIWRATYKKFPNVYPMLCIFGTIYNSESYLKHIVKSLIPKSQKESPKKKLTSLKLPDLSFITNPDFEISSNDINKTQNGVKFDNLGTDFGKLFTENVFTKGSTFLPKLDLEKISKNTPLKPGSNSPLPASKESPISSAVKTEPPPNSDVNATSAVSPMKNGSPDIPVPETTNNNLSTNVSAMDVIPPPPPSGHKPSYPYTDESPMAPNRQHSNGDSTDNNELGIPDSLWMMQTNWQPTFAFNVEASEKSNETNDNVEDPFGQAYNTKSNNFYSDTYNIMGDPTFGFQTQYGANDNNTGYWNGNTTNHNITNSNDHRNIVDNVDNTINTNPNEPIINNKKVPPLLDESYRYTPNVFDMDPTNINQNMNSRQPIINNNVLPINTNYQQQAPSNYPIHTSEETLRATSNPGYVPYMSTNSYYKPQIMNYPNYNHTNMQDNSGSQIDNSQPMNSEYHNNVTRNQSSHPDASSYMNPMNRPYPMMQEPNVYQPTTIQFNNENVSAIGSGQPKLPQGGKLQPENIPYTNQSPNYHNES